tara:strand:- start:769 stop:1002 length:234 start_codon:yes stop_codon:yes gene_type:complete
MPKPIKTYKSGNLEGSIWVNEKDLQEGGVVEFKTVSLRKSWRDNKNVLREQRMSLRKTDVDKLIVVLKKLQEDLHLE